MMARYQALSDALRDFAAALRRARSSGRVDGDEVIRLIRQKLKDDQSACRSGHGRKGREEPPENERFRGGR